MYPLQTFIATTSNVHVCTRAQHALLHLLFHNIQVSVFSPCHSKPYQRELEIPLVRLGRALAGGHLPTISKAAFGHDGLRDFLFLKVLDLIDNECSVLCRRNASPPSPFRKVPVSALEGYQWRKIVSVSLNQRPQPC